MNINSKFILFLATLNLFSFSPVLAQFPPIRKYTNLTYHNNWSAEVIFNGNPYMICQPNKVIGTYQIIKNVVYLVNLTTSIPILHHQIAIKLFYILNYEAKNEK